MVRFWMSNVETFEASSPSGHYFEHGWLVFDQGPSRTCPEVGVLPVICAKPFWAIPAQEQSVAVPLIKEGWVSGEGVEDVRANQAGRRKSANIRF